MAGNDSKPALPRPWFRRKLVIFPLIMLLLALVLGLGLGLGLGLRSPEEPVAPTPSPPNDSVWHPTAGTTWQIVLLNPLSEDTLSKLDSDWKNIAVFDIDLFTNPPSTFAALHAAEKRVICYFSAGSYEPDRPDSDSFAKEDMGAELDGWPGEFWLNSSSPAVRDIMVKRMDIAVEKGCDAVDPDNVDGFDNTNGLGLTSDASVDFMKFLASAARSRNLAIGLKNAVSIVDEVVEEMQFAVNEQCVEQQECAQIRPFIDGGKPVFGIEYPDGAPAVSAAERTSLCHDPDSIGFSTLLKELNLGEWVESC